MKYTLTTYRDGEKLIATTGAYSDQLVYALMRMLVDDACDEYEITNARGHRIAYAMTEDSPTAKQMVVDDEQSKREAAADDHREMRQEIQRDELAMRNAQRGTR